MTDQLELLPAPEPARTPTPRQQAVLDALIHAGPDGLDTTTAGAIAHAIRGANPHPADKPCRYCGQDGRDILRALRAKGLAVERRKLKVWVAVGAAKPPAEIPPDFQAGEQATFGALPAGY